MKNKKDCKIVQDLLPNYIDKLTSEETKKYIEEHITNCEDCKNIYNLMQKDINLNESKSEKKKAKYMKKYNRKLKILKMIILIIIIIFVAVVLRKMIILKSLENKAKENINPNNFYKITYEYQQDTYSKIETIKMDDKMAMIITKIEDGKITKTKMYSENGKGVKIYKEDDNEKTIMVSQDSEMIININNPTQTDNFFQLLISSMIASIKETKLNGKECYYIANLSNITTCQDGTYIDKDTGLMIRTISTTEQNYDGDLIIVPTRDYVYEFNTVTEEDFIEPNLDEYKVVN